ncbi:hypothetical protein MVEN_02132200 [Mycena venus]|uniref:F-box domain-containing protein n=1 Tax=Mycena venus TaxID=2733690 RepID=A0A8H7CIT5_9AGAR|nr:hypothetical protein MVEN_02132200 [Mycena venus]
MAAPCQCWHCGAPSTCAATPEIARTPSLDFTRLLTSNDVPLDSEIPFICDIISEGQASVDALNVQIDNFQRALAQVVCKRDAITERIRQHRAIVSPIRHIPSELICEILALTLPGDNGGKINRRPPWHFGHICRPWRLAALGNPSFWSSIIIPSLSPRFDEPHPLLPMIETQLSRSASALLTVSWSAHKDERTVDPRAAELVLAECSRWKTLRLSISHKSVQLDWLNVVNGCLTALETLEVFDNHGVDVPDVFSMASSLRKAVLPERFGDHSPPNITRFTIPWERMTHYSGKIRADKINAPCILHLVVWNPSSLRYLEAPLLEELVCVYSRAADVRGILPFVHSSGRQLKKLVLMHASISPDLIAVLQYLPNLTYLFMEDDEHWGEESILFDAMTIGSTSDDLCPNLTSLLYGFRPNFTRESVSSFFTMTRSRLHAGSREAFRLRLFGSASFGQPECPECVAAHIEMLRDEGYDVAFLPTADTETFREGVHFEYLSS